MLLRRIFKRRILEEITLIIAMQASDQFTKITPWMILSMLWKIYYLWIMVVKDEISKKLNDFNALCQIHKAKYLYAFGSSVTDRFDYDKSDIDLLVEIDDADLIERGEKLISLWDTFESFFQRKVDLLTDSSIRNPYLRKSIDSTKILIYDGAGQKVLV